MRTSWISFLTALALVSTSSSAMAINNADIDQGTAGGSGNNAAIFQKNDGNLGTINQGGDPLNTDNKAQINQDARTQDANEGTTPPLPAGPSTIIPGPAFGVGLNEATINQTGASSANQALIDQSDSLSDTPNGNLAEINQNDASNNQAKIRQKTIDNDAFIDQSFGDGSSAYIRQDNLDGFDTATIQQSGFSGADNNQASIIQGNQDPLAGNTSVGGNVAEILQDGADNQAFINQAGAENNIGPGESAYIDQFGDRNQASIVQTESANDNVITQIFQDGDDNKGHILQSSSDNVMASIDQSGNMNDATLVQAGVGSHSADIVQGDYLGSPSDNNTALVYQDGGGALLGHLAIVTQNGAGLNEATVIQTQVGVGDMATITQDGLGNHAWSIQGDDPGFTGLTGTLPILSSPQFDN